MVPPHLAEQSSTTYLYFRTQCTIIRIGIVWRMRPSFAARKHAFNLILRVKLPQVIFHLFLIQFAATMSKGKRTGDCLSWSDGEEEDGRSSAKKKQPAMSKNTSTSSTGSSKGKKTSGDPLTMADIPAIVEAVLKSLPKFSPGGATGSSDSTLQTSSNDSPDDEEEDEIDDTTTLSGTNVLSNLSVAYN